MKIGEKVLIVGRFDMSQKTDAIKMEGTVTKITDKRIYVAEQLWALFCFDRRTKKEIGGHWRLRKVAS